MKLGSKGISAWMLLGLLGTSSAFALEVPLYDRFETNFTQAGNTANPYTDVSASVTFTQPDGNAVTVPMFWDGEGTWRVRFSPWLPGTWSYTTSSSDAGLNNQSGTFDCIASTNKGSMVLKADAAHHFAYQDGTPVWWFGDTNWYQFSSIPAESLNRESANAYITARASQGFNVVHGLLYTTRGNEGGPSFINIRNQSINPAYWQEIDQRVAHMNANGIVAGLVLAWGFGSESWLDFPSAEAQLRFARYVAARYSAYNVYFLAAAEWGFWPHGKADGEAVFRAIAQEIANNDPHERMIGVHADTSPAQAETFATDAWSSFGDYQQYYGGASSVKLATDATRHDMATRLADSREHGKPVINAEYAYYLRDKNGDGTVDKESSHNRDDFRKASWVLAMTGGYFVTGFGSTYRGGLSDAGAFDVTSSANDVAIGDLTLLRKFFQSQEWWALNPRNDLVTSSGYQYGLASPGQTYVVYTTSADTANLSLGDAPPATYSVRRFDPRTGEYSALPNHSGTGPVALSAPDTQDWVYVVQNIGGSAITPVAHWKLNETASLQAADYSGHAHQGVLSGATWIAPGATGSALEFDGVDDHVDFDNPAALQITGSITLSAWVRPDAWATESEYHFISKRGGLDDRGWALWKDGGSDHFEIIVSNENNGSASRRAAVPLTPGMWHHITGVYDATAQTLDVYINGVPSNGVLTDVVPASQRNSAQDVNLGRRPIGDSHFDGALDEVRVYNRALSSAEVHAVYLSP